MSRATPSPHCARPRAISSGLTPARFPPARHERMNVLFEPVSRFYQSQGLRLHYADWGNEAAPPLILVHGGADQCRSWDAVAQALRPHFHVMAPDMRGH